MSVLDGKALIQNRVDAIREYHERTGVQKAHLSLSGGIDSAVMAGLLVEAVGRENVIPDHTQINSDPGQTGRASRLAEALGVPLAIGNFTDTFHGILGGDMRLSKRGGEVLFSRGTKVYSMKLV